MKSTRSRIPVTDTPDVRIKIPEQLLRQFAADPRIVIKYRPDGLWPLPPEIFRKIDWKQLASDAEFNRNFEVQIVAKTEGM